LNFIRNDRNLTEEDNANWGIIEVSKITNRIIEKLIENLKSELSDDFFISFESLIKIGKKAEPMIKAVIEKNPEKLGFRKDLFNFALNLVQNDEIENPLVFQLYNPDFITRARIIMQIEDAGDLSYLKYVLPLVEDPDDSVRWAAINFFINKELLDDPIVYKKLAIQMKKESNSVIQKKLAEVLNKK
jgi:HEAT repeat protein